jgi:bifunctional non-homologous end joining protein LigD
LDGGRLKPQLLSEVNKSGLDNLLASDEFALSQKLDGRRLVLERSGLKVTGWARSGLETDVPKSLYEDFMKVRSNWIFDGELIKNTYHVFDIIEYPGGSLTSVEWIERQNLLNKVLTGFSDYVQIVRQATSSEDKTSLYEDCMSAGAEGVVLCNIHSKYLFATRSSRCLKYKFIKSIDCVIIDRNIDSKDNLVLGLYDDNGEIVDVGKVSALTGDGKHHDFKVGEVVTVNYLYATESRRLYQPVKPKIRKDKEDIECLMSQLIFKTETIV